MRKQYYFPSDGGYDAWDVDALITSSSGLTPEDVDLEELASDVDAPYWFGADGSPMTVRNVVTHVRRINEADLAQPIILGGDGRVMDRMHRVARALLDGRRTILAVRFAEQPAPDHRDCQPSELEY